VFPHEYVADKGKETVPEQNKCADFEFAMCFLIGG